MTPADSLNAARFEIEKRGFCAIAEASRLLIRSQYAVRQAIAVLDIQPIEITPRFFLIGIADLHRLEEHFACTDADSSIVRAAEDLAGSETL